MRLIIVFAFALTLGAGITAGFLVSKFPHPNGTTTTLTQKSWLENELDLTPPQSEQIKVIWQGVEEKTSQSTNDAIRAREKRDADIQQLISPERLEQYRQINQAYDAAVAKLKSERDEQFNRAVKQTRELLNPKQQEKYNIILKQRLESGGPSHQDSADKSHGNEAMDQPSPS